MSTRLVLISDTHGLHSSLHVPAGDILVHAGDLTDRGTFEEVERFNEFLGQLSHPTKIVIAGNHDFCFERDQQASASLLTNCIYLQDEAVTVEGLKFYGSPWQPWFFDWAFNLQRGAEIRAKWDQIPDDTDVLITHGPAYGCRDRTAGGEQVGCRDLLDAIDRIRPRVHIFGHIHEGYGSTSNLNTTFINASICNEHYVISNEPIVFQITGN